MATSILQGLGRLGAEAGEASAFNAEERRKQMRQQLEELQTKISQQYADTNTQRFQLEKEEANRPRWSFHTVGNQVLGLKQNPDGSIVPKVFGTGEEAGIMAAFQRLVSTVSDPVKAKRMNDVMGVHAEIGDLKGGLVAAQQELGRLETEEATAKREKENQTAIATRETANETRRETFAKQQQARQQTFSKEQQGRTFTERERLSSLLYKAGDNAVAINSALTAIHTIKSNSEVLSSLIGAGKIALTADPDGTLHSIVAREMTLSKEEADVAAAFGALTEHINLMRGPLAATGFRGPQAWGALQSQRGNPLGNPAVTMRILDYTQRNLEGFQKVNKRLLGDSAFGADIGTNEAPVGDEDGIPPPPTGATRTQ